MELQTLTGDPSSPLWIYLIVIDIVSFAAMGIDKYKARHGKWRIPEKTLFALALLGGSAGGILGIYLFRHKTLHKKFTVGFPVILLCEGALLLWLSTGA